MGTNYDSVDIPNVPCPKCGHVGRDEDVQFTVNMGKYRSSCWHDRVQLGDALPEGFPKCRFEEYAYATCGACGAYHNLALLFDEGRVIDFRAWPEGGEGVLRPPGPRRRRKAERRKAAAAERSRRENEVLRKGLRRRLGREPSVYDMMGALLVDPFMDVLNRPSILRQMPDAKPDVGPYEHHEGAWRRRYGTPPPAPKRPIPLPA